MPSVYEPRPYPGTWAENRARIRRGWTVPLHFFEWLSRILAYYLSHWSLLEVLEYIGRFTVLVAVIIYFKEAPDRQKQKHYQAWQVINSASGKSGNGGRLDAMEQLNEDKVSLVGVDVSKAFLQGLQLPDADLHFSVMQGCDLRDCNLERANLAAADLNESNLRNSNLRGIRAAGVDMFNVDLMGADLDHADLTRADLRNADVQNLKWSGIASIAGANIHGIENAPAGFEEWAMKNGAVSIESDDAWAASKNESRAATKP
jgi:hypothetical protein